MKDLQTNKEEAKVKQPPKAESNEQESQPEDEPKKESNDGLALGVILTITAIMVIASIPLFSMV